MKEPAANSKSDSVYLCQVSPDVSCGACCGLYNMADLSPEKLEAMLTRRTHWFADVPRTVEGIDAFKTRVESTESQKRPFPDFHHCAFVGMIEDNGRRVGCLLHPLAEGNHGLDWRGLSYYGGMACRTYFCPSVRRLPARWLYALRMSMDHWYLHGLVVTERHLLTAFFEILEHRIGRCIDASDFAQDSRTPEYLREFASLKTSWPFRRQEAVGACNYFFEDGQYRRPALTPPTVGKFASPLDAIFRELDSGFTAAVEMKAAETIIEAIFDRMTRALNNR